MWEKTVMSDGQRAEALRRYGYADVQTENAENKGRIIAQAQAEISYKAGEVAGYKQGLEMREPYREGIRKVVEWVEENYDGYVCSLCDYAMHIAGSKWQAFKKELEEE